MSKSLVQKVVRIELGRQTTDKNPFLGLPFVWFSQAGGTAGEFHGFKARKKLRVVLVSLPEIEEIETLTIAQQVRAPGISKGAPENDALQRSIVQLSKGLAGKRERLYRSVLSTEIPQEGLACFNELALPSTPEGPPTALLGRVKQVAERSNSFVFAGTSHDGRTYQNTGYTFFPGSGSGVLVHKQVSAITTGELISTKPLREVKYALVFGLRVATIVCLDLADYAILSAVVQGGVDVLFVSCYTPQIEKFVETAKFVSKCMSGPVYLVNYSRHSASQAAYELRDGKERELSVRRIRKQGATVSCSTISCDEIIAHRNKQSANWPQEGRWMFSSVNRIARR